MATKVGLNNSLGFFFHKRFTWTDVYCSEFKYKPRFLTHSIISISASLTRIDFNNPIDYHLFSDPDWKLTDLASHYLR